MKKLILFTTLAVLIFINIIFFENKINMSSEANKQIFAIIKEYGPEYDHEYKLATK
jgi:uncharacterized membrane protein